VVRARVLLALLMFVPVVAAAPRAKAADPPKSIRIGLPENMFTGVAKEVVQVASQPFQSMFEKQTGVKGQVEVAKDSAEITDKLRSGKLDIALYNGFEYAWVKQHPELVPLVVAAPNTALKACLVVHADSKAEGPASLKGECVVVPGSTKPFCRLYLDRMKTKLPDGCCCPARIECRTMEEALDSVVRGKCDAVLVDAASLAAYQNNRPGVGKQLKVLAESDPFPPAVVVYRKDVFDAKTADKVRDGLLRGMTSPQGKLLAGLWRLKGFDKATPEYQTELDRCLKSYPPPAKK
jgi:ABC-type phosphate/phosphonate transport system substrate-binding protein